MSAATGVASNSAALVYGRQRRELAGRFEIEAIGRVSTVSRGAAFPARAGYPRPKVPMRNPSPERGDERGAQIIGAVFIGLHRRAAVPSRESFNLSHRQIPSGCVH